MQKTIVYLDDAGHALAKIASARREDDGDTPMARHWVLVACAPRLTYRIGKWVSNSAREKWRNHWADKVFGQVEPALRSEGDEVTRVLAKGPLPELTRELLKRHGEVHVMDARRPKSPEPPTPPGWNFTGTVAGLSAALMMAAD